MPEHRRVDAPAPRLVDPERLGSVVRMAFLVRLLALTAGTFGLLGQQITAEVLLAVVALAGSSFLGLSQPGVLEAVVRHPLWAMIDLLVVLAVFAGLGVQSPLALTTLSTALLIGVLFRARVSVLLGVTLVLGYAGAASASAQDGLELGFFLAVGMPVTFVCLIGVGNAFRRMERAQWTAEQELAGLLQANATAEERSRLAREVHDSLAKSLQGLAFGASALPRWVEKDGVRAQAEARSLARGAAQAVQEARTLLTRMRSDEPGKPFEQVLAGVAEAWAAQHSHPLTMELTPVPGLDPQARYELLASAREALENVQRHAPGAPVSITMSPGSGLARVRIVDKGPGFDSAVLYERERDGHFGVRGMTERMAGVGGSARIQGVPGHGTTVTLAAPVVDPGLLPRN